MRTIPSLGMALALVACGGGSANRTATREPPPGGPIDAQRVLDTCIPPAERPQPARDLPQARRDSIRACVNAETARQYNEQLPLRVGAQTVMDEVSVDGHGLVFRYTMASRRADLPPDFNLQVAEAARAEACADPGFRTMVSIGGMQTYRWVDRDGVPVGEVKVDRC